MISTWANDFEMDCRQELNRAGLGHRLEIRAYRTALGTEPQEVWLVPRRGGPGRLVGRVPEDLELHQARRILAQVNGDPPEHEVAPRWSMNRAPDGGYRTTAHFYFFGD